MKSEQIIKKIKEMKKDLIEIKYFADQKKTSRTSVYRAIYSKKINQVVLGKSSKFVILDENARKWKPGK